MTLSGPWNRSRSATAFINLPRQLAGVRVGVAIDQLQVGLGHIRHSGIGDDCHHPVPSLAGLVAEPTEAGASGVWPGAIPTAMADVQASLEEYRGTRGALEAAVLPFATSVDGRRFTFQVSLHGLELEPGGYMALEGDGSTRLGQLLSLELRHQDTTAPGFGHVRLRAGGGDGVVLHGDGRPFHDAVVRRATADEVGAWLEGTRPDRAQLDVGELALAPGVPFRLDAGGFGRHTFLCGQSGSGKTYSLGVLLERLLMETNLRVVVLDPNSDYVRLGEPRVDDERYRDAAASVQVRGGTSGPDAIRSASAT